MSFLGGQELPPAIDADHLRRQRAWSEKTFGPGSRTDGIMDHIRKEFREILDEPEGSEARQTEWIDVVILALDGAWRSGLSPEQIIAGVRFKQARNEQRRWPDWRTAEPGKAIEHDRSFDPEREPVSFDPAGNSVPAYHTDFCLSLPDAEYDPACARCASAQAFMTHQRRVADRG